MLYIRTDMNEEIATGHVMRCLSIADAARLQGEDTTFILADMQAVELIKGRGYCVIVLNTLWCDMESEIPSLIELIKENNIKKIIIDSYQVTVKYLETITLYVRTIYIDDLNAFFYPVDRIICYANYWKKNNYYDRYEMAKLFLGPKYVPLQQEYCNCKEKHIKKVAESVLLMSGGTDPYGILERILFQMNKNEYKKISVICGKFYSGYQTLKKEYQEFKNIYLYQNVPNIHKYMEDADIAVSAGGTTLYELCACGTPTISYTFSDNQLANVYQFQEDKIIDYAGDARDSDPVVNVLDYLNKYKGNRKLRLQHSQAMQRLVDGKGASRIVHVLKDI